MQLLCWVCQLPLCMSSHHHRRIRCCAGSLGTAWRADGPLTAAAPLPSHSKPNRETATPEWTRTAAPGEPTARSGPLGLPAVCACLPNVDPASGAVSHLTPQTAQVVGSSGSSGRLKTAQVVGSPEKHFRHPQHPRCLDFRPA